MLSPLDTSETLQCVECSPVLEAEAGLIVDSALLQPSQDGFTHLAVTNPTGLPQWVGQGTLLGEATSAVVEETDAPCPENWNAEVFHDHVPGGQPEPATTNACDQELSGLRRIDARLSEEACKEKLLETQRLIQKVLMGLNPQDGPDFVSIYIDDVIIFSHTLDDHLDHIQKVIKHLQKAEAYKMLFCSK